jgi:hypothetical protein
MEVKRINTNEPEFKPYDINLRITVNNKEEAEMLTRLRFLAKEGELELREQETFSVSEDDAASELINDILAAM